MARNTYPLVQETSTLSADGRSWLRVMVWLPTRYTVAAA